MPLPNWEAGTGTGVDGDTGAAGSAAFAHGARLWRGPVPDCIKRRWKRDQGLDWLTYVSKPVFFGLPRPRSSKPTLQTHPILLNSPVSRVAKTLNFTDFRTSSAVLAYLHEPGC